MNKTQTESGGKVERMLEKRKALVAGVKELAKAMIRLDCGGLGCSFCPLNRTLPGCTISYCDAIELLRCMDDV